MRKVPHWGFKGPPGQITTPITKLVSEMSKSNWNPIKLPASLLKSTQKQQDYDIEPFLAPCGSF